MPQTGPGGLPLALRLSEGLGLSARFRVLCFRWRQWLLITPCRGGCFSSLNGLTEFLLHLSFLSFGLFYLSCLELRGRCCRARDVSTARGKESRS